MEHFHQRVDSQCVHMATKLDEAHNQGKICSKRRCLGTKRGVWNKNAGHVNSLYHYWKLPDGQIVKLNTFAP